MLPDRVSNPGPLTYESGALPIALRGTATNKLPEKKVTVDFQTKLFVYHSDHLNCDVIVKNTVLTFSITFKH